MGELGARCRIPAVKPTCRCMGETTCAAPKWSGDKGEGRELGFTPPSACPPPKTLE